MAARILVTGGAGFLGSAFVRHALRSDADVRLTTFDALTYAGGRDTLGEVLDDPRHDLIVGDVRDAGAVRAALAGHDAVVHYAAESHVDRSIDDPDDALATNVLGTANILRAAADAGLVDVLHVSTDEVYGSVPAGRSDEDAPLRPNSPYSASKASADLLCRSWRETYGLPVRIVRTSNCLGPRQYPEKLVPLAITTLLDGGVVPIYGDGGHVRDWTYVDDAVAAHWMVLTSGAPGGIYNVGAGNEATNRDLVEALCRLLGLDAGSIEHVADRPGHDRRYAVDATRVRQLGWAPRHDLDAALEATVGWYRENERWWRPRLEAGAARRRGLDAGPEVGAGVDGVDGVAGGLERS